MSKPVILVFAGPNGSGKSTITTQMPQHGVYVNADNMKKEYGLNDLEAAQKAEAIRNKLVEKKANFTFETVLSTGRNLQWLRKAKESGYEVQCIYVLTCKAGINVARVRGRVREGGHDVPEDKIRSRYVKALKLLPLIFTKDEEGNNYFPTEIWTMEKLKELLKC